MRRRNTNRKVRRNTNRKVRRNTNRKVRRNTNRKVRRNTNRKVRRNTNRKVRRNSINFWRCRKTRSTLVLSDGGARRINTTSAKTGDEFDQRRATTSSVDGTKQAKLIDINKSYLDMIRGYEYTNPDVLNTLVRRGRDPEILAHLKNLIEVNQQQEELNKHLSKGSNSNPGIAKFLVAKSEETPLSMIASYHLGSDHPVPPIGNTGKGVLFMWTAANQDLTGLIIKY